MSLEDYYKRKNVPKKTTLKITEDECGDNRSVHHTHSNVHPSQFMSGFPSMSGNVTNFLVWILVVGIIVYLILSTLRPSWILNPNSDEIDTSRLWLATIGITILILLLIWLLCASRL